MFSHFGLLLPIDPQCSHNFRYNNLMLSRRTSHKKPSIFFRGISLRQYMDRSAELVPPLQYKDDQDSFIDQEQKPLFLEDVQVYAERRAPLMAESRMRNSWERSMGEGGEGFPTLNLRREGKELSFKGVTERNSTDDSLPGEIESQSLLLPQISQRHKQDIVRERNITMASRSSSRSVSCRRRMIPAIPQNEESERGESNWKRIAKGLSLEARGGDTNSEVLRKKKEKMREYSLVRNKRVGKGAVPLLTEN